MKKGQSLSPEMHIVMALQRALAPGSGTGGNDRDAAHRALRLALALRPTPNVGPGWHFLRGVAESWLLVGERHPLRGEMIRLCEAAIAIALKEDVPARPTYTGGAARYFDPEERRLR